MIGKIETANSNDIGNCLWNEKKIYSISAHEAGMIMYTFITALMVLDIIEPEG